MPSTSDTFEIRYGFFAPTSAEDFSSPTTGVRCSYDHSLSEGPRQSKRQDQTRRQKGTHSRPTWVTEATIQGKDINCACNFNLGSARKATLASSVTCVPIHWHQARLVVSHIAHSIISSSPTDSYFMMQRDLRFHSTRHNISNSLKPMTRPQKIQQWLINWRVQQFHLLL